MDVTDLRLVVLRYLARNGCGNACEIANHPDVFTLVSPESVLGVLEDLRQGGTVRLTVDPQDHRQYDPIRHPYKLA